MKAHFQLLSIVTVAIMCASSSQAEPNITYYLSIFPPFLGADVATSIPLSISSNVYSLWLFGDTITGTMSSGQRTITAMPRNSVALFQTVHGVPQSTLAHFIRYATDPDEAKHIGFWSPDEESHWFLPAISTCSELALLVRHISCFQQVLANCWLRVEWCCLCICHEHEGFWRWSVPICAVQ
jgi:hypothetical protein